MRSIDFKSLLIGVLATALVAVVLGADKQQPATPHYQISAAGPNQIIALDNSTNQVYIIGKGIDRWGCTEDFSLEKAMGIKH